MSEIPVRFALVSDHKEGAKLPTQADVQSAGYDFYLPENVTLPPGKVTLVFTDVKVYMPSDAVLFVTIRSSLAKQGILLANAPGVIDASYVDNPTNEGNIGLLLYNTTSLPITLDAGSRVAQGICLNFLKAQGAEVLKKERTGGFGSSGK